MVAHIVGMITGCVCMVSAIIYLNYLNSFLTQIIVTVPPERVEQSVALFVARAQPQAAYVLTVTGAVVLLLSAVMMALSGRTGRAKTAAPKAAPPAAAETPPAGEEAPPVEKPAPSESLLADDLTLDADSDGKGSA